ncbi:MAG TPA: hypothetical protein VLE22_14795, partial [Bryobacteraceae bacterium]|nr:hypothetical protein [Bryobacteraceae bacterium]
IERMEVLREMVRGAMLCSDATLHQSEDGWLVDGDPSKAITYCAVSRAGDYGPLPSPPAFSQ